MNHGLLSRTMQMKTVEKTTETPRAQRTNGFLTGCGESSRPDHDQAARRSCWGILSRSPPWSAD